MGSGLYIGRVTNVADGRIFLAVTDLHRGRVYGPVEGLVDVALMVGDRVLVGLVGGRPDDVAIVRQLP